MITNQTMHVDILGEILKVEHKTWMGSLTDLFNIGNGERLKDGLTCTNVQSFLRSDRMKSFIKEAAITWDLPEKSVIEVRGKGRGTKTYAHLSVLIAAAEYLSPRVHNLVIREFIEGRLLQFRDSSGDEFKLLNQAINEYLPEGGGRWVYIKAAEAVRDKIKPPGDKGWNLATANQLKKRDQMEKNLHAILKTGLVRDKEHLLEIIEKI